MRKKAKRKKKPKPGAKCAHVHLKVGPTEVACRVGGLAHKGRGWTCSADVADVTCAGCRGTSRFRFAVAQPEDHLDLAGVKRKRPRPQAVTPGLKMPATLWAILQGRAKREGISTRALVYRACRRLLATPDEPAGSDAAPPPPPIP